MLATFFLAVFAVLAAPAMAQVCNGTNVVTAQSPLNNKVPGPPSPTSTVALRYTFGNDATSDCDSDAGNGGVSQRVTQAIVRPSCNLVGGACVDDAGSDDGNPATPAVAFLTLDNTDCAGGLANITVDATDPFSVKLRFAVPLIFPPNTNCSVDVTLNIRERGNATTTNTIAQQYSTDGQCQCTPELSSAGAATSQLFLTCPPCNTNFCSPEACNATTVLCEAQPLPNCTNPDNDLCTPGSCDPAANNGNGACVNGPRTVCGNTDNDACTAESCVASTGQCVSGPRTVCGNTDNDLCTSESCNAATGACDTGPRTVCPNSDNDLCTSESCNAATGQCVTGTRTVCGNENNFCHPGHCAAATGQCVSDTPPDCSNPDNDLCTPGLCDATANGGVGACANGPRTVCGNTDNDLCTSESCTAATGNCDSGPRRVCDNDTCQVCAADTGECVDRSPQPAACAPAICRTPGFWGTHAGTEKRNSTNITEAVIDCADGNCQNHTANDYLLICGEKIDSPDGYPADGTTDVDDAASSTEALCVSVRGAPVLQLARQLTSAALNCIISGGGRDCSGTALFSSVFADCNAKCASGATTRAEITACVSELDCLNNGNSFSSGICSAGAAGNCHQRLLVNSELGLDFDPPGAAGSSDACNAATGTTCTVVSSGEALCHRDSLP